MNASRLSQFSRRFSAPLLAGGLLAVSFIFSVVGCGSGSGTGVSALPVPGAAGSTNSNLAAFVGRTYAGQIALTDGQIGTVSVVVAAGGTASGTLEINDLTRKATTQAAKSRLIIATPFLSGTFDPATGAINLSGSYTVNGQVIPISIVGTLPTPPSVTGGSYSVTINGQTFSSTFGSTTGTNPTPSATPTPNPSGSPTPSPSASPAPASGAVQFAVVSQDANCNFVDPGINSWTIQRANFSLVPGSLYQLTSVIQGTNKSGGSFTVGWQRLKATTLVPETFTFVPVPQIGAFGDDFQGILQTGVTTVINGASVGAWRPTGGQLVVQSVNGSMVTVHGEKVEFSPTTGLGINRATGKFIADFTVTYDKVTGL